MQRVINLLDIYMYIYIHIYIYADTNAEKTHNQNIS